MKKRRWKNGTYERSGWELGSEGEECGSLRGRSFVCVHVSEIFEQHSKFKKNWRGLLFSNISSDPCETCSSHWASQQNWVSLVAVKLMPRYWWNSGHLDLSANDVLYKGLWGTWEGQAFMAPVSFGCTPLDLCIKPWCLSSLKSDALKILWNIWNLWIMLWIKLGFFLWKHQHLETKTISKNASDSLYGFLI